MKHTITTIRCSSAALAHCCADFRGVPWELIGAPSRKYADRGATADARRERCLYLAEASAALETLEVK